MNTLPAVQTSSYTHYDLFELEKIHLELETLLDNFYKQKEKLLPVVVGPNSVKFTQVQTLIAKYHDLKADLDAKKAKEADVGKAIVDRLNDLNTGHDGFIKNKQKCKKLYKKINHLIHPDKLPDFADSELCASFQLLASQYYEEEDYEALLALFTDINLHLSGAEVDRDVEVATSTDLNSKIFRLKQMIQKLEQERAAMDQDEFSRVIHVHNLHGKQMAIVFYSKVLDAQLQHFNQLISSIEQKLYPRSSFHTYPSFFDL